MSKEDLQKAHERELGNLLGKLGGGKDADWALVRALVHQAVHLAADRKAGEFCALATLFAEMIQHAHEVMHPTGPSSSAHEGTVH